MKSAVFMLHVFCHVLRGSDKSHHPVSMVIGVVSKHRDLALMTPSVSIKTPLKFSFSSSGLYYYLEMKYFLGWILTKYTFYTGFQEITDHIFFIITAPFYRFIKVIFIHYEILFLFVDPIYAEKYVIIRIYHYEYPANVNFVCHVWITLFPSDTNWWTWAECVAVPRVFSYTCSGVKLITLIWRSFTVDEKA